MTEFIKIYVFPYEARRNGAEARRGFRSVIGYNLKSAERDVRKLLSNRFKVLWRYEEYDLTIGEGIEQRSSQ